MRSHLVAVVFALPFVFSAPSKDFVIPQPLQGLQTVLNDPRLSEGAAELWHDAQHQVGNAIETSAKSVKSWIKDGIEFVETYGVVCMWFRAILSSVVDMRFKDEHVKHRLFPDHQLRVKSPKLCDSSVKQHSGYLDIADEKHLFFWFETRFSIICSS